MIRGAAVRITDRLLSKEVIVREEYEIYQFGLEQLLSTMLSLLSVLTIGLILDVLLQSIVFVTAYKFIRQYAGGYHASTPVRCYALSIVTVIIVLSVIKYIPIQTAVLLILSGLSGIIIWLLAPVDTENKRIDIAEYRYFRKRTKRMLWVELLIAVLCAVMHFDEGTKCIVLALVVLALALVGEKMKGLKNS